MTVDVGVRPPLAPRYLGDGVYAHFDGYHIILTVPGTAHDTGRDQRIALEPAVLRELNRYDKEARS